MLMQIDIYTYLDTQIHSKMCIKVQEYGTLLHVSYPRYTPYRYTYNYIYQP